MAKLAQPRDPPPIFRELFLPTDVVEVPVTARFAVARTSWYDLRRVSYVEDSGPNARNVLVAHRSAPKVRK